MSDELLCDKIECVINRIVHTKILPVLASTADQTTEMHETQRQILRELKGLRGKFDALEADFEKLREEHERCPHCGTANS